ncbi:MAG: carbohydrate binding domain-containing protein [Lachnospiraceae bacterium]
MKKKVQIALLAMLLTLLFGSVAVHAEGSFFINMKTATINIGDEENQLVLEIEKLPEGRKTRWVSWNENIAVVDQEGQKGVVTALRKGKAIISSGIGFPRETCLVTVVEPGIKLNKTAAVLYCAPVSESAKAVSGGDILQLKATVKGADKNTMWRSSNKKVAVVDPDTGKVTAVSAGTADITATANGVSSSCKITVKDNTLSLNLDTMLLSTKGAGSTVRLVPTVVGANKKVAWKSDDAYVATVKGGKVTGKKAGVTEITATANGVSAKCKVRVEEGLVSVNEEHIQLYRTEDSSETKQLKTNASRTDTVVWTSSDEKIASVDSSGLVSAKGAGTALITASCNGKTDTCIVEVADTATRINERIVHLKTKGTAKTYALDWQVTGRKTAVKWKSSNTKVASVSKGKITAKKPGTATITAEANGVTDTVLVTVQEFTPSITLNQREYTLYTKGKGNTISIKAKVDGADKKAVWRSSNPKAATVNDKGKVTAANAGSTLITAEANGVTAKCWVRVKESKVTLEKKYYLLNTGDTQNLAVDVVGQSQSVKYKSSNTKAVAVRKGVLTAKKAGSAEISVTANGITAKCHVMVTDCKDHEWKPVEEADREEDDVAATCEERGLTTYVCAKCSGKKQDVVEPLGHQFGRWTVTVKATEQAAGLEKQVCSRCKAENTRSIPVKNKVEIADAYKLVWEDEFDGDQLNMNDWNFEYHEPGWVNAELQEYGDSPKNTYVKDGNLYIQALKEIIDGKPYYTSGRINTQGKHDFQYGRFEVRAKVPSGKGFLPAFWMMPTDESYYGQWPKCGEIDVMEVHGSALSTTYGTLHFGEPHTQKQGSYTLPDGQKNFGEDFHVFACEWDPDEFRFYMDDVLFYTVNDWFTKKAGFGESAYPAPYDQPFYMILNLAVGGSWVGYPDEDAVFGDNAQFVIDYVRVYQKDSYDLDVNKPENEVKLRDPDETGNYIVNGDFAKAEDLTKEESNWRLLLAGGGEAQAEISGNALHITSTSAGDVNYGVQVVQANLPMESGAKYKLTYDAYADEARTMITGISAPDKGYIRYLNDTTVNLTTEKQSYEHIFDMTADSDANGRVEFNLGNQGSLAKVHLSNVRLEKTGAAEEEEKGILPDGNYVYNGQFNEGNEPGRLRLAYWDWDTRQCRGAKVSVTADSRRELKVTVPETVTALEQVVVSQNPIAITGGKKFVLSFDAYADQNKTIRTVIARQNFESALTTERSTYKYEFETEAALEGSTLQFLLGAAGTTYIDNVRIQEDGMIVNGDFASGMTGYEVYVNDAAKVPNYIVDGLNENNAFSMDIADTGAEAWYIQLKQNNIKLEKDKWYKLAFDAKSTTDREIMYALQRDGTNDDNWTPYSGEPKAALTKDYQNFATVFKMDYDTDPNTVLSISLGAVGGKRISEKHTVVIDNITLEETAPQEEIPPEPDTEMIQNGDFAAGEEHWESFVGEGGEAEISFAEEKAVYQITKVGNEDWSVQLKHKELLTLEKEAVYQVKMKLKSTESRTVKYSFLDPSYKWYGGEDLALTANEVKEVMYELKVTEDTSSKITFSISMGNIAGEETPASTIEIDDISVIKLSGGTDTPEKPEEPDEPVAIGTELIKNGDFADGETNWIKAVTEPGVAEVSFAEHKAVYQITNVGTLDHNVQLKQSGLKLEQGANYKVNMKLKSTESRTVKVALLDPVNDYAYYGGMDIALNAGRQKSISRIITVEKDTVDTIDFLISMGKIGNMETPVSTIEIDDISIIKVESGTQPDEETEEPAPDRPENPDPDEPENPDEPVAVGTELIKNGDFADGETNWIKAVTEPGVAEVSFAEHKAVYQITNVGTLDHNVQLKQSGLKLEQGANYKVNMKLKSTESRTVKVALLDPVNDYAYYGGMDIALNAGRQKSISRIITVEKDTVDTIDFLISMGKIGNMETPVSTIEIDDISIIKVESGTQSDEETEEPAPEADGNTSNEDTSNSETTEGQNIQPEAEESDEKSEPSASQTDEPQSESDEDEAETATAQTTEEENDETNTESVENDSSANPKDS